MWYGRPFYIAPDIYCNIAQHYVLYTHTYMHMLNAAYLFQTSQMMKIGGASLRENVSNVMKRYGSAVKQQSQSFIE